MDSNMLFPIQQHLSSALCEVRECNAYSSRFGLILREDEIAELVQGREEALRASALGICDFLRITDRFVREYVTSFALNLLPRLEAALKFGDVSNIFIE